jgi:hypothetical protein
VGGGKTQFCIIFNERQPQDGSRLFCHPSRFLCLQQKTKKHISAQLAIIDSKKNSIFIRPLFSGDNAERRGKNISVRNRTIKKGGGE